MSIRTKSLVERTTLAFEPTGALARGLASSGVPYESREGQVNMARAVAEAIEQNRLLLCEAGTGTGKTLAYLVPALMSGLRVVVSTATKALQEQIYTKDLPVLARHLGISVNASLMKGLNNYVCLRRLKNALRIDTGNRERTFMLARIESWLRDSETGDRAELEYLRDEDPIWREVQSGSDTRIGSGCEYYERCFVTKMRENAQHARLIVVNHHLYLADIALRRDGAKQGVIPEHEVVIFDEAHQLEDIATEFFGLRISSAKIDAMIRDAKRSLGVGETSHSTTKRSLSLFSHAKESIALLDQVAKDSMSFFSSLTLQAEGIGGRTTLPTSILTGQVQHQLHKLDAAFEALSSFLKVRENDLGVREEIAALHRRVETLRSELTRITNPKIDEVAWIDVRARSCVLGVSPIDLSSVFHDELFAREDSQRPQTMILTSATLATANADQAFVHAKRQLGLTELTHVRELVVHSPFDYPKQAGLYIPTDLPEPNQPHFLEQATHRILELIQASEGGAFVLCASMNHMKSIHARLEQATLPYPLYCQGQAPKISLLALFRAAGNAVLVATMGFWEGVDVPGAALRLVILDKLPFAIPSDPVVAARYQALEAAGQNAFMALSVPETAILLKQGFGRLIRTQTDTGVVAILDKRIRTKWYGRKLKAALPDTASLHTLQNVHEFFHHRRANILV